MEESIIYNEMSTTQSEKEGGGMEGVLHGLGRGGAVDRGFEDEGRIGCYRIWFLLVIMAIKE